jgi:hypothetical protein
MRMNGYMLLITYDRKRVTSNLLKLQKIYFLPSFCHNNHNCFKVFRGTLDDFLISRTCYWVECLSHDGILGKVMTGELCN